MSNQESNDAALRELSREEMMSALFEHMVVQNTNMALMFLGKVPHPQSGESVYDIQAARLFIDQLEMLEFKTKGNLTRDEEKLLKQSLTPLRLAFFEAVEHPPKPEAKKEQVSPAAEPKTAPETKAEPAESEPRVTADDAGDAESRKRYSKRY